MKALQPDQRIHHARRFGATGLRSLAGEQRELVERDRDVFHEHRIRHVGAGVESANGAFGFDERPLIFGVLGSGQAKVDGSARQVGELAADNCGADFAGDRHEHEVSTSPALDSGL